MINSELRLDKEPKPQKCDCGGDPEMRYNGLFWIISCKKCSYNIAAWEAIDAIRTWNGGGEDG